MSYIGQVKNRNLVVWTNVESGPNRGQTLGNVERLTEYRIKVFTFARNALLVTIMPRTPPKKTSRPRTEEGTTAVNWRLPKSYHNRLTAYSKSVHRSTAWVICDLIDSLPASLARREAEIAANRQQSHA